MPRAKESLAAKARRRRPGSTQRERPEEREPGRQPDHQGPGLEPAREPGWTEWADSHSECRSCGASLAGARQAGRGWAGLGNPADAAGEGALAAAGAVVAAGR